jgi:cell wall-associated NlpC family hydrolase
MDGQPSRVMLKAAGGGLAALTLTVTLVAAATGAVTSQLFGSGGQGSSSPSASALSDIPPGYLLLYQQAAATCPGLDWTVLAGIGRVETNHGRSILPGVRSGSNSAGAQGPMQFLPATFAEYSQPIPEGGADPPSPYDPVDAIYAAARMLCANGARSGADIHAAIYAYNHTDTYVDQVLAAAHAYAGAVDPGGAGTPVGRGWSAAIGQAIAERALQWLGWPYSFDAGNAAGPTYGRAVDYDSRNDAHVRGFDCSGLVLYALAPWAAVDHLASAQYSHAGQLHPSINELQPGDLVFWSSNGTVAGIGHVAIYLGGGQVVQAPHSGAYITVTDINHVESGLYGATRPLTATT